MKLFKKLLPIATVAATAACVVPMVTSCANGFMSTTDVEYKAIEHPEVQLENENAVIDEYFKNPKYFASDAIAYGASIAKTAKEQLEKTFKTGYTFNAKMIVNSINVGEAKTIPTSNTETYGYVISTKMSISIHLTGEQKEETWNNSTLQKIYGDITETITFDLTDIFATLTKDDDGWTVETSGLAKASDKWAYGKVTEIGGYVEFTYKDGSKQTQNEKDINSVYKSKQSECGDIEEVLPKYIASSFAKVTSKA